MIAFAEKQFTAPANTQFSTETPVWPEELDFQGMVGMIDPPRLALASNNLRPETSSAIRQCKEAGVRIFMITGDHPTTARAIAAQIGLVQAAELVGKEEEKL